MSDGGTRAPRVAVRLPAWLGDAVACEPAVRALAQSAAELTLVGPARFVELLAASAPGAAHVALDAGRAERRADYRGHDAALFLNGSWRSAALAVAAGVRERVGFASGGRAPLFTRGVVPARERGRPPIGIGRVGRTPRALPRPFGAACIELAGELGVRVADTRPRIEPGRDALAAVAARLAAAGLAEQPFALVDVGARPGSAKGYPAAAWRAVLERLAPALGRAVVVTAGPGEEPALDEAVAGLDRRHVALAVRAPSLRELAALAARAALFVGPDSGPRHLALAAGTPSVVVYGPTDPRHTAWHLERTLHVRHVLRCGPCHRERCPLAGPELHACMVGIAPEEIVAAARGLCR